MVRSMDHEDVQGKRSGGEHRASVEGDRHGADRGRAGECFPVNADVGEGYSE